MSENPIAISNLNDFIFCPVSIYFHLLDYETEKLTYQNGSQINGTAAHESVDSGRYSDLKTVLQAIPVYSEKYGLFGKIDIFDVNSGVLTERKKKIANIYDGYVFQLYAQYFSLCEMEFERLMEEIRNFSFDGFRQLNFLKCRRCIYEPLCSFSCEKSEE